MPSKKSADGIRVRREAGEALPQPLSRGEPPQRTSFFSRLRSLSDSKEEIRRSVGSPSSGEAEEPEDSALEKRIDLRKLPAADSEEEEEEEEEEKDSVPPLASGSFVSKLRAPSFLDSRQRWQKENGYAAPRRSRGSRFARAAAGVSACVLVFALLLSTVFARLTVTVQPKTETVSLTDAEVVADANAADAAPEKHIIPAEYLEFSERAVEEFPASATAMVEEKARGRVVISNGYSASAQGIVARSRFITDSGMIFRSVSAVTIPGAKLEEGKIVPSSMEAEVVADSPGAEFNIKKGTVLRIAGFQGTPKYNGFQVAASADFSGGFKGESRVASKEDIAAAQEEATKKVYEKLAKMMKEKIPSGFVFADGLRQIEISEVKAPEARARGDRFSVEAVATGKMIVFRKEDVFEAMKTQVLKGETERELMPDSAAFTYQVEDADFSKKRAVIAVGGNVTARKTFSASALAAELAGKKEGTLGAILKGKKEFEHSRLSFFPPWLFSAPSDPGKIKVKIKER